MATAVDSSETWELGGKIEFGGLLSDLQVDERTPKLAKRVPSSLVSDIIPLLSELEIDVRMQFTDANISRPELLVRTMESMHEQMANCWRLQHQLDKSRSILREHLEIHNSLQICCRLPDELFAHIFVLCHDRRDTEKDGAVGYNQLFVLSGICRRWRNIALASPRLWSTVSLRNLALAGTFLSRAKSAPIYAELRDVGESEEFLVDQRMKSAASMLKDHLYHLSSLTLHARLDTLQMFYDALIGGSLSLLRTLCIKMEWMYGEDNEWERAQIDSCCFSLSDTPLLENVSISNVYPMWDACAWTWLTAGNLKILELNGGVSPTRQTLLEIFRSNPWLEEVKLQNLREKSNELSYNLQSNIPSTNQDKEDRISLPGLRRLSLDHVNINLESLLTEISTPADLFVSQKSLFELDRVFKRPRPLFAHLPAFSGDSILALKYEHGTQNRDGSTSLVISYCRSLAASVRSDEQSEQPEQLVLAVCYDWQESRNDVLRSIGLDIALPRLHSLHLRNIDTSGGDFQSYPDELWDTLFSHLATLVDLVLQECDIRPVVHALTPKPRRGPSEATDIPCPDLKTLSILPWARYASESIDWNDLPDLVTCLSERKNHHAPFHSLKIAPSNLGIGREGKWDDKTTQMLVAFGRRVASIGGRRVDYAVADDEAQVFLWEF